MKFKIDENLPAEIAIDLASAGHNAETIFDEGHAGCMAALAFLRRSLIFASSARLSVGS
jgi:hypothetical protein